MIRRNQPAWPGLVRSDAARPETVRRGTTLVEVLLSMLLMAIGLVTLATLFPAAILRTVRAHQLTTGTILRFNAETFMDLYPTYVDDWEDNLAYPAAQPTPGTSAYIVVDPQGYLEAKTNPGLGWNKDLYGDTITRQAFDTTLSELDLDGDSVADDKDDAILITMLPDSWEVLYDAPVVSGTATATSVEIDKPEVIDEGITLGATIPAPVMYRVTLFSDTGRGGRYRFIDAFDDSTKTISWLDNIDSITSGDFSPERVRVEVSNPKFSWLMTVRRSYVDGTQVNNNVDVVVFFNRNFEPDAETVYTGSTLTLGSTEATLNATGLDPPPKNGNFLFDAEKCNWYRIVNVESGTATYTLTIDRPAVQGSSSLMLVRNVVDVYPLKSFTTN